MKNLLTLFVLFFSSSVFGEWITYAEDNGISYHYEDKTIRQTKNFVYVWNLISYEEEQKVQQISFHSMVSYFKIDCKINANQFLTVSLYSLKMSRGDKIHEHNVTDPEWNYAEPGTFNNLLNSVICNY